MVHSVPRKCQFLLQQVPENEKTLGQKPRLRFPKQCFRRQADIWKPPETPPEAPPWKPPESEGDAERFLAEGRRLLQSTLTAMLLLTTGMLGPSWGSYSGGKKTN